jgi:hypothetical protein
MSAALRAVRVTLAVSCVVLAACRATPDAPSDAFVSTGEEALRVLTRSYSDVPVRIVGLPRGLEDAALAAIRELLQQYAEPEREEAYLDDAAFELQLLLRERGYPAATVEYAVTGLLGEERAELLVSAGPEVTVEGVRLEGAPSRRPMSATSWASRRRASSAGAHPGRTTQTVCNARAGESPTSSSPRGTSTRARESSFRRSKKLHSRSR